MNERILDFLNRYKQTIITKPTKKTINLFNMNNDFLKPIDTVYKGYKFRSRLEARWAVFFDSLGLKWQYEVEGFNLSDGRYYLPDFRVTSEKESVYWYEIKPLEDMGDGKLQRFALDWGAKHPEDRATDFTICSGDPYDVLNDSVEFIKAKYGRNLSSLESFSMCPRCAGINKIYVSDFSHDEVYFECYQCDLHTPSGSGNPEEIGAIVPTIPHKGVLVLNEANLKTYISKVENAYNAARSVRF